MNGRDGAIGKTPASRADELFYLLRQVHHALERHGIWHCLMFGSLLGAIRDGEPISWDHDVDLLVPRGSAWMLTDG